MSLRLLQGGCEDPTPPAPVRFTVSPDGKRAHAQDGTWIELESYGIFSAEPGSTMWVYQ